MDWNVERMAEAGNRYAQFYLGWIFQNVIDVAEDDLAVYWFRQGIELNKTMMCEGGRHGNEGKTTVVHWCRQTKDRCRTRARCTLGDMWEYGHGVIEDYKVTMQCIGILKQWMKATYICSNA